MPIRIFTALGVCVALLAASPGPAQERSIIVASTTSPQDSGLLDHILPLLKAKTGIDVRVLAPGPGHALDAGRRGAASVVLAQAQALQDEFFVNQPLLPNRAALIVDESDPHTGIPTMFSAALRAALRDAYVAVYGETVDFSRLAETRQEAILQTYLKEKYSGIGFGVVAAVGPSAFELVRRLRSELWPSVPVVFAAIDETSAAELQLDSDITGLIMHRTIKSMMVAARLLVPNLKGVAVLGGPIELDPYRRQYLRELPQLATEVELTNLTGLPLAEQVVRAATLPSDTVILYTSLFIDDSGSRYSSPDALAAIARVANRPIVIDVESLIGLGATGGFVLNNASYGRETAALMLRILDGARPATIPVAVSKSTQPVFDWRQLSRWQISESMLPKGSEIRFRPPTAWEQYHWQIVLIAAAFLAQTSLIAGLYYERRRRRQAEAAARRRMGELAHMNRSAAAGEMSASIAHEINQPLAAIVTSANAGLRWLASATPNIPEVAVALKRIVNDGHRAGQVIATVRAMFKRDAQKLASVDINELIREVLDLLEVELYRYQISVRTVLSHGLPRVLADRIQLQQVMLNLIRNAVDAMVPVRDRVRLLRIGSEASQSGDPTIVVEDTGQGIDPANLDRIFEPFFTTKSNGMGMGLSISRSIIEAHGGRLTVAPAEAGGLVFRIVLPLPS